MQTRPYDTLALLKLIQENRFRIPQFQRDFRWSYAQIKLLIDSMARNYPMGSLLVMAKNIEIPMQSRSITACIESDCGSRDSDENIIDDNNNIFYVLDGQQRLTSIARVFLNGDDRKSFYFDLKEMIESFSSDADDVSWIKVLYKSKNKDADRRENNRFIRSDIAIRDSLKTEVYVYEYIEDSGEFKQWDNDRKKQREEAAKIKNVFEILRKYQVPIVVLEHDAGLESVCRVFETINSTGIRLTTFDLAVARFYPKPDLREKWGNAQELNPVLKEFKVDGERVLQILTLEYAEKNNKALEATRATQLKLPSEYIENNWDTAVKALVRAYEWAKSMGARPKTLTNHALLVAIASHWCVRPTLETDHMLLKRWFFSNLLQTGATQAANYRISRYFKALKDLDPRKADRNVIPKVYITSDVLLNLNRVLDSRFKALQCILSAAVTEDLITGVPLDGKDIDEHHIFPKAYCKKNHLDLKICESIVNRIAISRESNSKLSDDAPEKYFNDLANSSIKQGVKEGMIARLRSCFIPNSNFESTSMFIEQFSPEKFNVFMAERADLLIDEIKRVIGDSLVMEESNDYEEEDV